MGKFRVRSKNSKKGSRWAKGQSSSSNPSSTKHRDEAKNRMIKTNTFGGGVYVEKQWPSKLTAESLLKHDALMGNGVIAVTNGESQDDTLTLGQTEKTFETFASDWTQCTNMSFGKLMRKFNTGNPQHREMLAILAAVTEVIKDKGGEETSTEYLAVLLTTLETAENEDNLAAILSLISMVIKTVAREVLVTMFSKVSKLLLDLLSKKNESNNTSMVRSLIGCLSVILRAQPQANWQNKDLLVFYDSLFSLINHTKPKIRKASQHAICSILRGSHFMIGENPPDIHPVASRTAKQLLDLIEANIRGTSDTKLVLHAMMLLKEIVAGFPANHIKSACETVLKLMPTGTMIVRLCVMQVLHGLCSSRPEATNFPPALNARLITALYDYLPSINDAQQYIAWMTVQQEALINLMFNDKKLCFMHLPRIFETAVNGWTSDKQPVVTASTTVLKALTNECIGSCLEVISDEKERLPVVKSIISHVETGFSFRCHQSLSAVFHLVTVVIDIIGPYYPDLFGNCLRSLSALRPTVPSGLTNELDFVVGKAVRILGPEAVLKFIPLQLTGNKDKDDFTQSWLLPVFRENIQKTKLSFFTNYFLPLAGACYKTGQLAKESSEVATVKTYEALVAQIWSLLPGFCNGATDVTDSFKGIARTLGEHLHNRSELRINIMASLRQLILKCKEPSEQQEISRFAKNFLPILFNLYTTEPSGPEARSHRMSVFETIKLYFTLADRQLLNEMFDKCVIKLEDEKTTLFVKDSCWELLRGMVQYLNEERLIKVHALSSKNIGSKNHTIQKRAYRILEEICSNDSDLCREYVQKNILGFQKTLLDSFRKTSPPSQAARLRCMVNIVRNSKDDKTQFVHSVIPETILCMRASNASAREAAFTFLVTIGEALPRWHPGYDTDDIFRDYMKVILAGLAGNPGLIECTILSFTGIYYQFRDLFPDDLVQLLLENTSLLVTGASREVVGASLKFLKVFVSVYPVLKGARHIEKVITGITNMTESSKRHFRLKTRFLLNVIVRKYGYELVSGLIPKDDETMQKRLKNVKKIQQRAKKAKDMDELDQEPDEDQQFKLASSRPKSIDEILADSDEDIDGTCNDEPSESRKKSGLNANKKKTRESYITENSDGIVDLLDPSAAQMVTSSKPGARTSQSNLSKKPADDFKIGADGRFIIKDDSDDDEEEEMNRKGQKAAKYKMDESSDEEDENHDGNVKKNTFANVLETKKRKRDGTSVATSRRSKFSNGSEPAMKYQAGGSGIHRPTKKANGNFGEEYKAKKASGDVKKAGKPDPFAYLPLQKSALNKRKRAKMEGQFRGLVKATHKGAKTGKAKLAVRMKKMKI